MNDKLLELGFNPNDFIAFGTHGFARVKNFDKFKDYWRDIQKLIPQVKNKFRYLCPYCGRIMNQLAHHLKNHNSNFKIWYDLYTQIPEEDRLCMVCGKRVYFDWNKKHYPKSHKECSYELTHRCIRFRTLETHPDTPIEELIKWNKSVSDSQRKKLLSMNTKGRQGWHSRAEDLLAAELATLGIRYKREVNINNKQFRMDFYLIDYNIFLEEDGDWKAGSKKELDKIKYKKLNVPRMTGISVKNIWEHEVYYYKNHLDELKRFIEKDNYPLSKIYKFYKDLTNP